jgi:hypothetical protein
MSVSQSLYLSDVSEGCTIGYLSTLCRLQSCLASSCVRDGLRPNVMSFKSLQRE